MDSVNVDLKLINREELIVSGVLEVLSLKEDKIAIKTGRGVLNVLGEGLVIKSFTEGETAKLKGEIKTLSFSENFSGRGFLKSLTK